MNEATLTTELNNLLRRLWLWPIKGRDLVVCPRCHTAVYPPGGRPDVCILDARAVIEVKMMTKTEKWDHQSFPFSLITPEQRAWLTMWTRDGNAKQRRQSSYLALGCHGTAGHKDTPRMLWVVPWNVWRAAETVLGPHRESLPLVSFKGQRPKAVQEQGLNAMRLLARYALDWHDGAWHCPELHPLEHLAPPIYLEKGERDTKEFREAWKKQLLSERG